MKRSRSYICAATSSGSVNLLDPLTFTVVRTWKAHSSKVNSMDAQHDYIVTCGYALRQGQSWMLDPLVNVFDLKNMAQLPPVPFPAGAAHVRMHPRMSTTIIITSQNGQMHIVDLMNPNTSNVKQANCLSALTMIEIAPSGEAMALADAEYVHLWGSPSRALRFAEISNQLEFPHAEEPPPQLDWTPDT
jgi:PAB-dependent poly(A)-specific ribonuclease subunit 2